MSSLDPSAGSGVLILGGPTASGKTDLALRLADRWGARLVSADAMQVYRGLDIGTAKPSPELLQRYPHAGIDIRDPVPGPEGAFDAAAFRLLAEEEIRRGRACGQPTIIVGGTTFYLRSLLTGLVPTPPPDPALRQRLESLEDPHARLQELDPALAERLHPNDRVRVLRGIEVFEQTGQRLSALQEEHARQGPRLKAVRVWLDREDLKERIDRRVLIMMEQGYLQEVRDLLERGVTRDLKPMRSLGYRHLADHLLDGLDLDEAVRRTQRDSRRLAKRQRTFLKGMGGFTQCWGEQEDSVFHAAERAFTSP